jgi:hypothetical protein
MITSRINVRVSPVSALPDFDIDLSSDNIPGMAATANACHS